MNTISNANQEMARDEAQQALRNVVEKLKFERDRLRSVGLVAASDNVGSAIAVCVVVERKLKSIQ